MIFHVPKRWRKNWTYGTHIGKKIKIVPPDNTSSTLKRIPSNGFNNIKVSLRNLGTSPVATCTCERSFFAMRRLKAHAKGIMVSERLNAIALMHVHQEIVSDREKSHKSVNLAYFYL